MSVDNDWNKTRFHKSEYDDSGFGCDTNLMSEVDVTGRYTLADDSLIFALVP